MSTAVKASMAAAWARLPASRGRSPSIGADERHGGRGGLGVVGADEHVGVERRGRGPPAPTRAGGGRRPPPGRRAARPGRRRPSSPGAGPGRSISRPCLTRALAIETTTLPSSCAGAAAARWGRRRPRAWPRRPGRAPPRPRWRRRRCASCRARRRAARPATSAARSASRDPMVTGVPGRGQAQAEPPPERAGPSEDPDVHRNTLAQRPGSGSRPTRSRRHGPTVPLG